jgi:hypothetical protein
MKQHQTAVMMWRSLLTTDISRKRISVNVNAASRFRLVQQQQIRLLSSFQPQPQPKPHQRLGITESEAEALSSAVNPRSSVHDYVNNGVERVNKASKNESYQQRINSMASAAAVAPITPTTSTSTYALVQDLSRRVEPHAWKNRIEMTAAGERAFSLDAFPTIDLKAYQDNNKHTAEWLRDVIVAHDVNGHGHHPAEDQQHKLSNTNRDINSNNSKTHNVLFYVGFEAFYDVSFESFASFAIQHQVPLLF